MRPLSPLTFAACAALLGLFGTRDASANPGITGYSGKPYNGVSETCRSCHAGSGGDPTLNITVPSALSAGQTAEVTIVVNGSRAATSLNAALSDGVVATKGQNTEIPFPAQTPGEVAAVTPAPGGASATYKFTFVAPNRNGPMTLWVAGMSASGGGTGGDGVSTTTRTITISGATGTPSDGGAPPTSNEDGGTSSGGTTGDGDGDEPTNGGTGSQGDGGSGSSGNTNRASSVRRSSTAEDPGGCAAARATRLDMGAPASAALAMLGALILRRRSSRRDRAGQAKR